MRSISIANQKGGSGKTNSTRALATWLHFHTNIKIIVFDLDFQQTLTNERKRDERVLEIWRGENSRNQKVVLYDEINELKPMYPIIGVPDIGKNTEKFFNLFKEASKNYDVAFIDLPGNIKDGSVDTILEYINYIFIPTDVDYGTVESTITFASAIHSLKQNGDLPNLKEMRYFFNKYTLNKNTAYFPDVANLITQKTKIQFLSSHLKDSVEMKFDNSTVTPVKGSADEDHYLYKLAFEFISIIQ